MLKLKRLQIFKLGDFAPTTLEFHDRWNIVLGRNGSGKTTLLKLISMIVRDDLSPLASTEFDIAFDLAFDDGTCSARVRNSRIGGEIAGLQSVLGTAFPAQDTFRSSAELRVHHNRTGLGCTVRTEDRDSEFRWDEGPSSISNPLTSPVSPRYLLITTLAAFDGTFEFSPNAERLDESLLLFERLHGKEYDVRVFQFADSTWEASGFVAAFVNDMLQKKLIDASDRLTFRSTDVSMLAQFAAETGFRELSLRFDLIGKEDRLSRYGNMTLYCTQPDGRSFIQTDLSYGQQRLWTFMYYLASNPSTVIADELVNGLHHRWIKLCLDMMGERQAFLTSQNPLLFDFLEFTSAEDVKSQFVLCSIDETQPNRPRKFSQMSGEKAAEFFAAYQIGVQQVSEILLTEGLW